MVFALGAERHLVTIAKRPRNATGKVAPAGMASVNPLGQGGNLRDRRPFLGVTDTWPHFADTAQDDLDGAPLLGRPLEASANDRSRRLKSNRAVNARERPGAIDR